MALDHPLPLNEWMRRKGVDNHQLASVLEVHPSTASRLRRGLHRPSAELSAKLREVTAGQVDLKAVRPKKRAAPPEAPAGPDQIASETALFHLAFDFVVCCCESETAKVELDTLDRRIAAARAIVGALTEPSG
jgi:DNA-binding transcriptional regulator YdaS (Cro superfamily)